MSIYEGEFAGKQFESNFSWIIENPDRLKTNSEYSFESESIEVQGTPFYWYATLGEDKGPEKKLRMDLFLNQVPDTPATPPATLVYEYQVTIPRSNQMPKVLTLWKREIQSMNKSFLNLAKMRHLDFLLVEGTLTLDIKLTIADCNKELFTSIEPAKKRGEKMQNMLQKIPEEQHASNLVKDLDFLLESGFMSDVDITIGEEEFKVHKVILAARSEIFRQNFNSDSMERESFAIDNCSAKTFKHFLKFIYTGKLSSNDVDMMELLAVAGKFRVKDLGELCLAAMRK